MPEFEDKIDDSGVVCPYCQSKFHPDIDDFVDGGVETCDDCGKKFHRSDEATVTYNTSPDCELNSEEHDWRWNHDRRYQFCHRCGKIRTHSQIEVAS